MSRRFEMSLDINATPEDVWRALTEAEELVRWFPLQARVSPGQGGKIFWGWDEQWAWESDIDAWEPGKRLRLVENRPAFDADGAPLPGPPQQLVMEFTLETQAGRTRLRLVHSGFGTGADWDDELESVSAGWQFELRGLRHYLERHKGRDRHQALVNRTLALGPDDVWTRLLGPEGFVVTEGSLSTNGRCVLRASTGDVLAGRVAWSNPGHDLFLIVDDLDDGVFRMATWRAGGKTGVQIWLSTYDARSSDRIRDSRQRFQALLDRLFA